MRTLCLCVLLCGAVPVEAQAPLITGAMVAHAEATEAYLFAELQKRPEYQAYVRASALTIALKAAKAKQDGEGETK